MQGNKHDHEKIRTDLLPVRPLLAIAKVLTHGAGKYGDNNWRKGLKWLRCYGAVMRHLFSWKLGEDIDKDSGEPHLACAATELLFLLEFATTHKELDDRIKSEPVDKTMSKCVRCGTSLANKETHSLAGGGALYCSKECFDLGV